MIRVKISNYISCVLSGSICASSLSVWASEEKIQTQSQVEKVRNSIHDRSVVIADINHHDLAKKEGVVMPVSRLLIFNDKSVVVPIIKLDPLTGLDLPLRALSYEDGGELELLATNSAWFEARYDLKNSAKLDAIDKVLEKHLPAGYQFTGAKMASGKMIGKGYGILSVDSDHDFDKSEKNLKKVIMSQGDTLWFGELNYQSMAKEQGVDIPRCTVMLFGGPKPGGVAMKEFPKLGLDAFCQKILLLEGPTGKVTLYYNSITALSEFHYGKASKVHQQLDQRITATYNMALTSSKNE